MSNRTDACLRAGLVVVATGVMPIVSPVQETGLPSADSRQVSEETRSASGKAVAVPIDRRQWDWAKDLLSLSPTQAAIAESLYVDYLAAWAATNARREELSRESEEVRRLKQSLEDFAAAVAETRYLKNCRVLFDELISIDAEFLAGIESLLEADQLDRFERVVNDQRRRQHTEFTTRIPGSGNELADILQTHVKEGEFPLELHEARMIFEAALTPMLVERYNRMAAAAEETPSLRASRAYDDEGYRLDPADPATTRRIARAERRLETLHENRVRVDLAIKSLNEQFLTLLVRDLPPPRNREIRDEYRRRVYPLIYPDFWTVHHVFDDALRIEHIDEGTRAQVESLRAVYEQSHEMLSESMRRAVEDWRIQSERFPDKTLEFRSPYEETMAAAKLEREKLALNQIVRLEQILGLRTAEVASIAQFRRVWIDNHPDG